MNTTPLSQDEFNEKKNSALGNEPVTKVIRIDDLKIPKNGLRENIVIIGGKAVSVSGHFIDELAKILGISPQMKKTLLEQNKEGEYLSKMVDAMKTFGAGKQVTLIANPKENEVISITDKPYSRIPNEELFGIAERLIDQYPVLGLLDVDVTGDGFGTRIYLNSHADVGFPGLKDEETFRFGLTLGNYGGGTSIGDFMLRLVCGNGMMGIVPGDNFTPKGISPGEIGKMFTRIADMAQRGFVPKDLGGRIDGAINTPASLFEIEQAYKGVTSRLALAQGADDTVKKYAQAELARRYFPGYAKTLIRLAQKGIDIVNLSDKQKHLVNAGMPVWDVVNSLTFLGSNPSEFSIGDARFLQRLGGKLLASEFDLVDIDLINA